MICGYVVTVRVFLSSAHASSPQMLHYIATLYYNRLHPPSTPLKHACVLKFTKLQFFFFFPGFDYIVKKEEKQKLCFGSGKQRDTSSKKGMSSFMRYYTPEDFPNIAPGKYNVLESFKAISAKV